VDAPVAPVQLGVDDRKKLAAATFFPVVKSHFLLVASGCNYPSVFRWYISGFGQQIWILDFISTIG
jgi:hypothetical protein